MSVFIISIIRTWVPILVGGLIAWIVTTTNLPVDAEATLALSTWLTLFSIALYYALIRYLETKFPWFGWLLGYAKAPALYVNPQDPPPSKDPALITGSVTPEVSNNTVIYYPNATSPSDGELRTRKDQPPSVPKYLTREHLEEPHNQMGVRAEGDSRVTNWGQSGIVNASGSTDRVPGPDHRAEDQSFYVVLQDNAGLAHGFTVLASSSTQAEFHARGEARADNLQGSLTLVSVNRNDPPKDN